MRGRFFVQHHGLFIRSNPPSHNCDKHNWDNIAAVGDALPKGDINLLDDLMASDEP